MKRIAYLAGLLAVCGAAHSSLYATVAITSLTPSVASPQFLGTTVTWTVKATDSAANPLTFQFNIARGAGPFVLARDFNVGTKAAGVWTAPAFPWTTIQGEGSYTIQVIAKDFISGESFTQTASYTLKSRIIGGVAVVHKTTHPLVALFSAPKCPSGSSMRVTFAPVAGGKQVYTSWSPCSATSMNFYVAGMYPSTAYNMQYQIITGGTVTNGPTVLNFTTGALPTSLPPSHFFPTFTTTTQGTDTTAPFLLYAFTKIFVPVATDLDGNIMWYYSGGSDTLLTRPTGGGTMLTIQDGTSWNSSNTVQQLLREIDLAGNIVHETNTGSISYQLVNNFGATDATPCGQITQPAPGSACLDDFHHEAIRFSINGSQYTAFYAHVEKLFGPGTQGSTANVDILSEMVIVLNSNWQVVWYYDAFQQLDIARTAPLGETCTNNASDCPTKLFLGQGTPPAANDWTHANTIDYVSSSSNPSYKDLILSVRNQDQVVRISFNNGVLASGKGDGHVVWAMGPPDNLTPSNFTFDNIGSDSWPWFSHTHDVTFANHGANFTINGLTGPVLTIFDNGNTRVSPAPLGLGCTTGHPGCNSRGMALVVDETNFKVTPVFSEDLGSYSPALGGAQLLADGDYFFQPGLPNTYALEYKPTPGALTGTNTLNITSPDFSYRAFQMQDLYTPPTQ